MRAVLVEVAPPRFELVSHVVKREELLDVERLSRNRPLNDSMRLLSVRLTGRVKSTCTTLSYGQASSAVALPPDVEFRLAHPHLPGDIAQRGAALRVPQGILDLLLRVCRRLQRRAFWRLRRTSTANLLSFHPVADFLQDATSPPCPTDCPTVESGWETVSSRMASDPKLLRFVPIVDVRMAGTTARLKNWLDELSPP